MSFDIESLRPCYTRFNSNWARKFTEENNKFANAFLSPPAARFMDSKFKKERKTKTVYYPFLDLQLLQ